MNEIARFKEAALILYNKDYRLDNKGFDTFFFTVKDYKVQIGKRGCSCTCEYGSMWGMKKNHLPCKHIITGMMAITYLYGAPLRERYENDDRLKVVDGFHMLDDDKKEVVAKEILRWQNTKLLSVSDVEEHLEHKP